MSDNSAIRMLQAAIEHVRATCTGAEYKTLIASCNACDRECEKATGQPDDSRQDEQQQPKNLKQAASKARTVFAERRRVPTVGGDKSPTDANSGVPDKPDSTPNK